LSKFFGVFSHNGGYFPALRKNHLRIVIFKLQYKEKGVKIQKWNYTTVMFCNVVYIENHFIATMEQVVGKSRGQNLVGLSL